VPRAEELSAVEALWQQESRQAPGRPILVFNGELDRIRGGYYPALFFPELDRIGKTMLPQAEAAYYIKNFKGSRPGVYGMHHALSARRWAWGACRGGRAGGVAPGMPSRPGVAAGRLKWGGGGVGAASALSSVSPPRGRRAGVLFRAYPGPWQVLLRNPMDPEDTVVCWQGAERPSLKQVAMEILPTAQPL
jgi:hypothetical protein